MYYFCSIVKLYILYYNKIEHLNKMKLKFNDYDLELVYSFRSNIYYESIQNRSLDLTSISINDLIVLFYCVVIASQQKAKKEMISMIDFLDVVDENGGDACIIEFSNWYSKQLELQYENVKNANEETPAKKKKTKKTS